MSDDMIKFLYFTDYTEKVKVIDRENKVFMAFEKMLSKHLGTEWKKEDVIEPVNKSYSQKKKNDTVLIPLTQAINGDIIKSVKDYFKGFKSAPQSQQKPTNYLGKKRARFR